MKEIDLSKSIYELTKEEAPLLEILFELGFIELTNKRMLKTVGRVVTLKKGCQLRKISYQKVITTLKEKGYQIKGE